MNQPPQQLLPRESFSFTPGFSPVLDKGIRRKPFQRFSVGAPRKPLKRFPDNLSQLSTGLKPGVNERNFESKL